MINVYEEFDKKVYRKKPSFCIDCGKVLMFKIRSNKRCTSCYKIERRKKDKLKPMVFEW